MLDDLSPIHIISKQLIKVSPSKTCLTSLLALGCSLLLIEVIPVHIAAVMHPFNLYSSLAAIMLQPTVEIGSTKKIIVPVAFTLSMPAFEIIVYKKCTTRCDVRYKLSELSF